MSQSTGGGRSGNRPATKVRVGRSGERPTTKVLRAALSRRWFRLGLVVALAVGLAVAGMIAFCPRSTNYLDMMLGCVVVPGIKERGFYNADEMAGMPIRWTNGSASLVVPIRNAPPQSLSVMLAFPVARPARVLVRVNGHSLWDGTVPAQQSWAKTFDLAGVPAAKEMKIDILSDDFVPAEIDAKEKDRRILGAGVLGVVLHSVQKEFVNVPLGTRPIAGLIEESGFYSPEGAGAEAYRWSDGKARLVVPLGKTRPRRLSVSVDVMARPTRLAISVNGKDLIEGEIAPQLDWKQTLALNGLDLGDKATIEVASDTWVPAEVDSASADRRLLGVKIKRIVLLDE